MELFRDLGPIIRAVAARTLVMAGSVQLAFILDAASSLTLAEVVHLSGLHVLAGECRHRADSRRRNQAIVALARCRSDGLFAMLHDGTLFEGPALKNASSLA